MLLLLINIDPSNTVTLLVFKNIWWELLVYFWLVTLRFDDNFKWITDLDIEVFYISIIPIIIAGRSKLIGLFWIFIWSKEQRIHFVRLGERQSSNIQCNCMIGYPSSNRGGGGRWLQSPYVFCFFPGHSKTLKKVIQSI